MGKITRALALLMLLTGCGGGKFLEPAGFVNHTQHADADLWAIWKAAQQNLATQVDINPLQRSLHDVPADILPGDARALKALPRQLLVASEPDVAADALFAATGTYRIDPTGLIACPQPCNVHYAAAYSVYQPPRTRYAQSWEFSGDNFSQVLQYEFENQILKGLGYNMQWR